MVGSCRILPAVSGALFHYVCKFMFQFYFRTKEIRKEFLSTLFHQKHLRDLNNSNTCLTLENTKRWKSTFKSLIQIQIPAQQKNMIQHPLSLQFPAQKTIYIGEKSSAIALRLLVTTHRGEGGLTFLFQQFMWFALNPIDWSDSHRFNKLRDSYNVCSCLLGGLL